MVIPDVYCCTVLSGVGAHQDVACLLTVNKEPFAGLNHLGMQIGHFGNRKRNLVPNDLLLVGPVAWFRKAFGPMEDLHLCEGKV